MNSDRDSKITEAMEQLRISYTMRQWRVCSLICQSLADGFKQIADDEDKTLIVT